MPLSKGTEPEQFAEWAVCRRPPPRISIYTRLRPTEEATVRGEGRPRAEATGGDSWASSIPSRSGSPPCTPVLEDLIDLTIDEPAPRKPMEQPQDPVEREWEEVCKDFYERLEATERAMEHLRAAHKKVKDFRSGNGARGVELVAPLTNDYFASKKGVEAYEQAIADRTEEVKRREKEARKREEEERIEQEMAEIRDRKLAAARALFEEREREAEEARKAAIQASKAAAHHAEQARRRVTEARKELKTREEEIARLTQYPELCKCMRCGRPRTITRSCPECEERVLRTLK